MLVFESGCMYMRVWEESKERPQYKLHTCVVGESVQKTTTTCTFTQWNEVIIEAFCT